MSYDEICIVDNNIIGINTILTKKKSLSSNNFFFFYL